MLQSHETEDRTELSALFLDLTTLFLSCHFSPFFSFCSFFFLAFAQARSVGWEGMQGSVEDVEIFGVKSHSDHVEPDADFNAHNSTV